MARFQKWHFQENPENEDQHEFDNWKDFLINLKH